MWMTEQVLKVLGKLDERNTRNIIWVTLEQPIKSGQGERKIVEQYFY